jgi:hypothetical protein
VIVDKLGIVMGLIALVCVLLPCKYDPAIRLKEWFEGWDDHEEELEADDH